MHRRGFLSTLGALTALAPWTSCRRKEPLLRVGIHPWIGYETLSLARAFGWLPPEVAFVEGRAASDSMAALRDGLADVACLTLDETLRARASGLPIVMALVFDSSAGADVVLGRSAIRDLGQLAGKRLGLEQGALGALMFAKLLEAAGLEAAQVRPVNLPIERHVEAWRRGEVDAIITYEPASTHLLREGAHVLFDSRRIPETVFDVLAVRTDRVRARKRALRALVAGHFRGLRHLQTHRQDAIYRIAARQGIDPEEIQRALSGVLIPSLEANRDYLSNPESRLLRAARSVSDILVRAGVLARPDSLQALTSPQWLPQEEA